MPFNNNDETFRNGNTGSDSDVLTILNSIRKNQSITTDLSTNVGNFKFLTIGVNKVFFEDSINGNSIQNQMKILDNTDLLKNFPSTIKFLTSDFKYVFSDDDKKMRALSDIRDTSFQQLSYDIMPKQLGICGIIVFQIASVFLNLPALNAIDSMYNQILFYTYKNGGFMNVVTGKAVNLPQPFKEDGVEFNDFVLERRVTALNSGFIKRVLLAPFWQIQNWTQCKLAMASKVQDYFNFVHVCKNVIWYAYYMIINLRWIKLDDISLLQSGCVNTFGMLDKLYAFKSEILKLIYNKNNNPFKVDISAAKTV